MSGSPTRCQRLTSLHRVYSGHADTNVVFHVGEQRFQIQSAGAVRRIAEYEYYLEILSGLAYDEVAQIFVRVNSGGRTLKTVDLALATLSSEWPGVVARIDAEIDRWRQYWPKIDAAFLVRALAAIATDTATLPRLRGVDAKVLEDS